MWITLYPWFKLVIWIFLAIVVFKNVRPIWFFVIFSLGGAAQSVIGFLQFFYQKSLGLFWLEESFLNLLNRDVARVFVEGGRLLRAYGTFPHPNILAAFLNLALVSSYFIFINNYSKKWLCYLMVAAIFLNSLGLVLTFSRAGWLVAVMSFILFIIFCLQQKIDKRRVAELIFIIIASVILLMTIFYWAVFPRTLTLNKNDFAIQERLVDYKFALDKILEAPLFGNGLTLAVGERPIHNLYLTIAVEVGLVGLAAFLFFIIYLLIKNITFVVKYFDLSRAAAVTVFVGLLIFGLFDHFLWTLRPGLAMFWILVGLLI